MKKNKIAIIDYGVGNLFSLSRAVGHFTSDFAITDDPDVILSAEKMILPGVGSFKAGMRGLKIRGLEKVVREFANSGRPVLGICLGAQLLMSEGREFGWCKGLDIIPGEVVRFPPLKESAKIPHIGWNTIQVSVSTARERTIFKSLPGASHVYFVHSYILKPTRKENVLSETTYGGRAFCSTIYAGNVYGTQFHPEKSSRVGLRIIKNFINLGK